MTERAPLFSDERMAESIRSDGGDGEPIANEIRDFYEDLITKGELKVVEKVKRSEAKDHVLDGCVGDMYTAMDSGFASYINYCPGCGARII